MRRAWHTFVIVEKLLDVLNELRIQDIREAVNVLPEVILKLIANCCEECLILDFRFMSGKTAVGIDMIILPRLFSLNQT